MKVFLIFLGLAITMVLGQVLMLRPSARDKALMALREAARREGLNPRLVPRPDWLRVAPEVRLLGCYTLFVEEGAAALPHWLAERQPDGQWLVRAGRADVLDGLVLPAAADSLLAIEVRANSLSIYWTEGLDQGALPQFSALLRTIAKKLK